MKCSNCKSDMECVIGNYWVCPECEGATEITDTGRNTTRIYKFCSECEKVDCACQFDIVTTW